jgi:hypothetical protein
MSDFSDTMTQSSSSGPNSPPRDDEDFDGLFRIPGLEQASHYVPHDVFHPLERLAEEGTRNVVKSPTHTPKSFKSYEDTSTSASNSTRYPLVKPKSLESLDELIPPSNTAELAATTRCADCGGNLFSVKEGGRYVTVPSEGNTQVLMYHTDCFRCVECHGIFKQGNVGQAIFVTSKNGPCHVEVCLLKSPTNHEIFTIAYRSVHQP